MNVTKKAPISTINRLAMDSVDLAEALGCGKASAVQIGTCAKARVQIGRRVLWNVSKVQTYLDAIATE